jgi:hypothetical protein
MSPTIYLSRQVAVNVRRKGYAAETRSELSLW